MTHAGFVRRARRDDTAAGPRPVPSAASIARGDPTDRARAGLARDDKIWHTFNA